MKTITQTAQPSAADIRGAAQGWMYAHVPEPPEHDPNVPPGHDPNTPPEQPPVEDPDRDIDLPPREAPEEIRDPMPRPDKQPPQRGEGQWHA
ncbi:hypothetical protein [Allopusillimonas ginsengisoli]|uniref:hypothetical protein n=1 Tax=Allopusillimonas ginsengisoli TaxID=453575 RepID=UPI00101FF134|nr:hypothetical protein [Allopusillimonas ginsengisoli]TEA77110.1 hypothetical protein ERE07_15835 [Allopusillimonas ginsengisoli]